MHDPKQGAGKPASFIIDKIAINKSKVKTVVYKTAWTIINDAHLWSYKTFTKENHSNHQLLNGKLIKNINIGHPK